jgi:hypothetical protein
VAQRQAAGAAATAAELAEITAKAAKLAEAEADASAGKPGLRWRRKANGEVYMGYY